MPYEIDNFDHRPHVIPNATETSDGVMSAADKIKLDGLSPGGGPTNAHVIALSMAAPAYLPFPGAQVGQRVLSVFGVGTPPPGTLTLIDMTAQFETTISLANNIRQLTFVPPIPPSGEVFAIVAT